MHTAHDFRQYPTKSWHSVSSFFLFWVTVVSKAWVVLITAMCTQSVRFTLTGVSPSVMFALPCTLLWKPPKGAAGIRFSLSHLLFLYFAHYVQASGSWQLLCPFPGGNPAKLMMLVGVPFIAEKCQTKYLGSAIGWRMRLHIIIYGGGGR